MPMRRLWLVTSKICLPRAFSRVYLDPVAVVESCDAAIGRVYEERWWTAAVGTRDLRRRRGDPMCSALRL
ncbi:hypothetical protein PR202_gb25534 [Eleusine coracana subsp. coracana]|uniref:Secreted protein n=1 Tax=Eleusine coracana subsp. coracana TaxID=191504 RepID=A0AAV5FLR0_ELECO|nr:hypothetical protein PR202_gb25534 [Eleusine coracana subsp. coracana]